jgi:pimeloyl-ACP methyl ester carboxylesterase
MHLKLSWHVYTLPILCGISALTLFLFHTSQKTPWQSAFEHYDMTSIREKLGYDPAITIYSPDHATNNQHVTVYVHAWGDSQKSIAYFRRNSSMLPGTIVGFNFKDASSSAFLPPYKQSNFCQSQDIASLVLTLKVLDECSLEAIHLFGHSRGGGTIVTMLARLHRYTKNKNFFRSLGITKEQATRIMRKVKAGSIVLNCPFVDMNAIIKGKLSWLNLGWLSNVIRHCLSFATAYRPNSDTPLASARVIQPLGFAILVHFQHDDIIMGNTKSAAFYKNLMGPDTYLIMGNDEGHIHTGNKLGAATQAFNKRYGGAYYALPSLLKKGETLLAHAQPTRDSIEAYIHNTCLEQEPALIQYTMVFSPWQHTLARYDMAPVIKKLGYNPHVKVYKSDSIVKGNDTTIYIHGYGDNQRISVPLFQLNSYMLPGTIVSFDFQDVIPGTSIPNLGKSNVGQSADIASLAMVLKILDTCGLETIHLFGSSRGGAVTLNTLARLCMYDRYADFFAALDISITDAQRIIRKIRAGTIVLNCPLVDTRSVSHYWFGRMSSFILEKIVPSITSHNPNLDQAIESAKILQPMNFNILVHFEHNDRVVGNSRDADFYKNIMGKNTYLSLANDGGHLHSGETLGTTIQAFRKRYQGAYYPLPEVLKQGNLFLSEGQPPYHDVESYVKNAYTIANSDHVS